MDFIRHVILAMLVLASTAVMAESRLPLEQDRSYDAIIESGYLKVGVYENFPPYSFLRDGEPAGIDVDIGRRIAEALGVTFQVHWIVPDETLEDDLRNSVWKGHYLARGRVADVMMRVPYDHQYAYMQDSTGEVINEQVVMFGPYQQEQWQIAYDDAKLDEVQTMAVFQYHPIGVEIDTLPDFYLTSAFGGRLRDHTRHYRNVAEAFDAIASGEVSAVMGMRAEIDFQLNQRAGGRMKLATNGFPGIGKQVWDVGMAVKQNHRQLGYAIEEIVDGMVRSGEMAAIFQHYGLRYSVPAFYQEILSAANAVNGE